MLMKEYRHFDALFLFKDFSSKGNLQIDSRLMAGHDASSIFCENLPDGCPNVPANILKNYPKNRLVISVVPTPYEIIRTQNRPWIIDHIYSVRENIYQRENWQDITQEVKDGAVKFGGINH